MNEQNFSFYSELLGYIVRTFRWISLPLGILVFTDLKKLKQGVREWIPTMIMGAATGLGCFCTAYLMGFGIQSFVGDKIADSFTFTEAGDLEIFLKSEFVLWLAVCISFIVLTLIALYVLYRIVSHKYAQTIYEAVYLSVPSVMAYLLSRFFSRISVIPMDKEVFVLSDQIEASNWVFLAIGVLLLICETFLVATWQKNRTMKEKEEQLLFSSMQTEALKKRLSDVEEDQRRLSGFRHDLKNHLVNLHGLLDKGAVSEAEGYLKSMEENMNPFEQRLYTGSALLDVILNDKSAEAEKLQVAFAANVDGNDIPEEMLYDLGVLLTNLLDNAIKASSEKRTEHPNTFVSLKHKGRFLVFKIKNTYSEKVEIDPATHLPVMNRKQISGHGIGIRNAVDICEKYLGGMEYMQEKDAVTVTGTLQMPPVN